MFKKLALIAAIAMIPAAAMAHFHSISERDSTIEFCENAWDNNTMDTVGSRLTNAGVTPVEIDYVLDMCMAYMRGISKGSDF